LCPRFIRAWLQSVNAGISNRGRDFPATWTGLDKPLEVKHTRYQSPAKGFLIVRPPRWTPGPMRADYMDDSYYVLLVGKPFSYRLMGWIDRAGFLEHYEVNPVGMRPGQRECWGVHWSKLRPLARLAEEIKP
jgi:hypothetical protein